jgi:hypothetical protein
LTTLIVGKPVNAIGDRDGTFGGSILVVRRFASLNGDNQPHNSHQHCNQAQDQGEIEPSLLTSSPCRCGILALLFIFVFGLPHGQKSKKMNWIYAALPPFLNFEAAFSI